MRVGLTYDLRQDYLARGFGEEETAEFDSPETIAAIEAVLRRRGFETDRIGSLPQLAGRLVAGERWDFVFNIAEGMYGLAREAQVPALLDGYDIPYTFADPLTLALALDKSMAKRVVRDCGIATTSFAVIEHEAEAIGVDLPLPLFAKPLGEGTGKGIDAASRIESKRDLASVCRRLLQRFDQPVLVEPYLPGREFTVGITGTGASAEVVAVIEILLGERAEPHVYSYENKEHFEDRVVYQPVDDPEARRAAATALASYQALRCRDGGRIDLRSDAAGIPQFMEANPLAGLHPMRSDLVILSRFVGLSYDGLINRIVDSCLNRCHLAEPTRRKSRRIAAG
jgi:D-alanine-D-alanine ligase